MYATLIVHSSNTFRGTDRSEPQHLANCWRIKPTRCHLLFLFFFLDTQHVSGINMSIIRSLRLCCWTTTLTPTHSKPRTKSANVVVQQHSRKILMMGTLMPEIFWVSKKKNKNSKWYLVGFILQLSQDARSNKHHIWQTIMIWERKTQSYCSVSYLNWQIRSHC